jgi:hypothetical protein
VVIGHNGAVAMGHVLLARTPMLRVRPVKAPVATVGPNADHGRQILAPGISRHSTAIVQTCRSSNSDSTVRNTSSAMLDVMNQRRHGPISSAVSPFGQPAADIVTIADHGLSATSVTKRRMASRLGSAIVFQLSCVSQPSQARKKSGT